MIVENRSILLFVGLPALLYVIVFIVVQGRTGASPGKALLGVRVVRRARHEAGFPRSTIRAVAWVIDGIALLLPVALWSACSPPGTDGWATSWPGPSWCARGPRTASDLRQVSLPRSVVKLSLEVADLPGRTANGPGQREQQCRATQRAWQR